MPTEAPRLLIAEDNAEMRDLLRRTLAREGYQVEAVVHGREALDRLGSDEQFDLLISDVRMPEMDGDQLLDAARRLKPALKIVMVTSFGSPEQHRRYMDQGAVDYLLKPFKIPDLLEVIERALAR
jgi:CheY-like chemotaxis protein